MHRAASKAQLFKQIKYNAEPTFMKLNSRKTKTRQTYIMFGGIPSLLHVHDIDVKHRPELHLDFLHQERL